MALTLLDKNNLETTQFEKYLIQMMDEIGFKEDFYPKQPLVI